MNTPITLLYAALNGLVIFLLSSFVISGRLKYKVPLGDGGNSKMLRLIRMHGNACEYIPVVLILLLLLELNGASKYLLHGMGATLFVGRIFHAYGLHTKTGPSTGRFVGTNLTYLALLTGIIGCLTIYF